MKKKLVEAATASLPPEIWDVQKACAFLGVGRTRLYELIAEGLPSRKIGAKRRFDPRDLALWWEQQKV
jgi:excisionase family DNA binding protein